MRTSELTGALLDYWTARAEGIPAEQLTIRRVPRTDNLIVVQDRGEHPGKDRWRVFPYSTDWGQGGPLIDKYYAYLEYGDRGEYWECFIGKPGGGEGETPLQAICRAVVRAAFGDDLEEVAVCN